MQIIKFQEHVDGLHHEISRLKLNIAELTAQLECRDYHYLPCEDEHFSHFLFHLRQEESSGTLDLFALKFESWMRYATM
jgi:hypothetical protein